MSKQKRLNLFGLVGGALCMLAIAVSLGAEGFYGAADRFTLATGSTTRRDISARFGEIKNVKDFGATGDGTTNDATAIQAAITSAAINGASVYLPGTLNGYKITTGLTLPNTSARPIRIYGDGPRSTRLIGTNITMLTVAMHGAMIEDLSIQDTNASGSASFIGIDWNNGTSGVANWEMRRVWVCGQNQTLDVGLATLVANGIGVRCSFGIKGKIEDCVIFGFNKGITLVANGSKSNANHITACKIRVNTIGIDAPASSIDDIFVQGSTIEGNGTGFLGASDAAIYSFTGNHWENSNVNGVKVNVQYSAGGLVSTGETYYGAAASKDVVTTSAWKSSAYGSTFNSGVTNNGTGVFNIYHPVYASIAAIGTGTTTLH